MGIKTLMDCPSLCHTSSSQKKGTISHYHTLTPSHPHTSHPHHGSVLQPPPPPLHPNLHTDHPPPLLISTLACVKYYLALHTLTTHSPSTHSLHLTLHTLTTHSPSTPHYTHTPSTHSLHTYSPSTHTLHTLTPHTPHTLTLHTLHNTQEIS